MHVISLKIPEELKEEIEELMTPNFSGRRR